MFQAGVKGFKPQIRYYLLGIILGIISMLVTQGLLFGII